MKLHNFPMRIARDNSGATAIEYGLIVALVVIGCIASISSVADENTGLWAMVKNKVVEGTKNG